MSLQTERDARREQRGKALRNRRGAWQNLPARPRGAAHIPDTAEPKTDADAFMPVSVVETPPSPPAPPSPPSRFDVFSRKFLFLAVPVLLALLLILSAVLSRSTRSATMMLVFRVPGGEDLTRPILYGEEAELPEITPPEGYTFLGWEDAAGRIEQRRHFPVYQDTVLTARLMPAFETVRHVPYLTAKSEGILDATGPVSMREFAIILAGLLDDSLEGSGRFLDVPEDDSCYEAAALLKDLGVLTGSRLHPARHLTRGEFLQALCCFYPPAERDCVFQDLSPEDAFYPCYSTAVANGWLTDGLLVRANPGEDVTRAFFARVMNRVLGRSAEHRLDEEDVGTVLDLAPGGEDYVNLLEAVIPHEYRMAGNREIWTESEAFPLHEPGFFFSGVKLHHIDEEGVPAVSEERGGLLFNNYGEVTTGDEELDRRLRAILEETIDPETMDREEMLHAVYDYVVDGFEYIYGRMYPFGADDWAITEAKKMLNAEGGNCYGYAALFYELARMVGYDAKLYSGKVYGEQYEYRGYDGELVYSPMGYTPHGWVEIEFDGEDCIFDAEYEYRSYGTLDMFKCPQRVRGQYGYLKPPEND